MSSGNKGFINFGNTCYLNSALQCLSHIDNLNNDKFRAQVDKYKKNNTPLLDEWLNIQDKMWTNDNSDPIHTMNLIKIFMDKCREKSIIFNSFEQNDTSEFLIYFLDFIHDEISRKININIKGDAQNQISKLYKNNLNEYKKHFEKSYSCIVEDFYSQSLSITGCTKCNYKTDNHEPVQIINLTLQADYKSLNDCLDEYVRTEQLDNDNKWKCDKCGECVNPEKKTIFWEFSPIMILLIKKYDENGILKNSINYPKKINMEKYGINYKKHSTEYELQGLCIHLGNLGGGHYYSICKNDKDNKWHMYNDNQVSEVNESNIFNNHPYCLFYKRV